MIGSTSQFLTGPILKDKFINLVLPYLLLIGWITYSYYKDNPDRYALLIGMSFVVAIVAMFKTENYLLHWQKNNTQIDLLIRVNLSQSAKKISINHAEITDVRLKTHNEYLNGFHKVTIFFKTANCQKHKLVIKVLELDSCLELIRDLQKK